jgi:enamine deaminase RidA (YjgF/YER057c/UK114 family)
MPGKIDQKLAQLGITLPGSGAPGGNYVGFVRTGNLVFLSGVVPIENGARKYIGKLGGGMSVEDGQKAAALATLSLLARLKEACGGDLDRVVRCVKVLGFVNAVPEFGEHPSVINGASDLIVAVFGEAGRHARSAVGMGSLPYGVAVEMEAVFEIRD